MDISKRVRAEIGTGTYRALAVALIGLAVVTILVALFAPRLVKIGVLAWEVLP